jgi:gluconate kinase
VRQLILYCIARRTIEALKELKREYRSLNLEETNKDMIWLQGEKKRLIDRLGSQML